MQGSIVRWAGSAALLAGLLLAAASPAAAKPRANLEITKLSMPIAQAAPGDEIELRDTVKNTGAAKAGPSVTRFYLSSDSSRGRGDALLAGKQQIGELKPGEAAKASGSFGVPGGTLPGDYHVVGCADAKQKVDESNEKDNCRATKSTISVVALPPELQDITNTPQGHSCTYGVGTTNVPIALVSLSAPAAGDTFISVTSSNVGSVTVADGGVTIPDGQQSATVEGAKLAAGTTTLTATEGAIQKSVSLEVRGVADEVNLDDIAPAASSVTAGHDVNATVTLDCEAPPGGTTVALAVDPASAAAVPAQLTVPAGENSATFAVQAGPSSGQATISATLGSQTVYTTLTIN
jgi:CARDB protein